MNFNGYTKEDLVELITKSSNWLFKEELLTMDLKWIKYKRLMREHDNVKIPELTKHNIDEHIKATQKQDLLWRKAQEALK